MTFDCSPVSSMSSSSPDLTTKKLTSRSPQRNSACPAGNFFGAAPAYRPSCAICAWLSFGNAMACKSCSAMKSSLLAKGVGVNFMTRPIQIAFGRIVLTRKLRSEQNWVSAQA